MSAARRSVSPAFALTQGTPPVIRLGFEMGGFLVQGWSAEEIPAEEDGYEFVTCLAYSQLHFVSRTTGKVLGSEDRE